MALAAIDCRPIRDNNLGIAALATLNSLDTIHSPTAAAAAGQRTPSSSRKGVYNGQLYGLEAVGRRFDIMHIRNGNKVWEKAQVLNYDPVSGQHLVKASNSKQEDWLYLADLKFRWSQVLPCTAPPNPTYRAEYSGETAVGKRLRVYWPAMQKWYQGIVKMYNPLTDLHTILYKDGDLQTLMLRYEPIMWCDDDSFISGASSSEVQHNATTPRHSLGAASTLRSRAANGTVPVPAFAGVAALPATAAAALAATFPAARGFNKHGGGKGNMGQPRPVAADAMGARPGAVGLAARPNAVATGGLLLKGQAAGHLGSKSGPGRPAGAASMANGSSLAGANGSARPPAGPTAAAAQQQQQQQRQQQRQLKAGDTNSKQQLGQYRNSGLLGKHVRDGAGQQDSNSKRTRRGQVGAAGNAAAAAAGTRPAALIPDKHLAVGCRVAVYWRLDNRFYRGKLTSYSPSTGKFQVKYDDGQSEGLLLERERFVWHSPRGVSAGYRPALHSLMQQLGAEGIKPLPAVSEDNGHILPETHLPQGAASPPSQDASAVGWRIKLYWAADQCWHEAEVLSFDEGRRMHHVLYLDGEAEWLGLARENLTWLKASRHGAISAGVLTSDEIPKGRDALGWHIAVYWKDDRMFYEGEIVDYENSTGRYKVLYVDGEEEWLHLRNERVIWRLAPSDNDDSSDDSDVTNSAVTNDTDEEDEVTDDDIMTEEAAGSDTQLAAGSKRATAGPHQGANRRQHKAAGGPRFRHRSADSDSGSASSGLYISKHGSLSLSTATAGNGAVASGHHRSSRDGSLGVHWSTELGTADAEARAANDEAAGISAAAAEAADGVHAATSGAGAAGLHHSEHGMHHMGFRRGGSSMRGRGPGGLGPNRTSSGMLLHRQGSLPAAGAGIARAGSLGMACFPNLPPLQLRRTTGSCETILSSPTYRAVHQSAEQVRLMVKVVPGVGGSAAPSRAAAAALQPVLQKLPQRQQKAAARLQRKMDQLQLVMGKLVTTAGTMGWRLPERQLVVAAGLGQHGSDADIKQQGNAADGAASGSRSNPTSPRGRWKHAASKAATGNNTAAAATNDDPTSPRGHASPKYHESADVVAAHSSRASDSVAATKATGQQAASGEPGSPRGPASPIAALAAGKPVAVQKSCAVKSRPSWGHRQKGSGARRCEGGNSDAAGDDANGGVSSVASGLHMPASLPLGVSGDAAALHHLMGHEHYQQQQHLQLLHQQQQAAYLPLDATAVQSTAGINPAAAAVLGHLQQQINQQQLQHLLQQLQQVRVNSLAAHAQASRPYVAAAAVQNALAMAAGHNSAAAALQSAGLASANALNAALFAAVGANPAALQRLATPAAAGASVPNAVSHPSAPSVQLTADDVVLRLQAIAAARGGGGGGGGGGGVLLQDQLQQQLQLAAAKAAVAAAAAGSVQPAEQAAGLQQVPGATAAAEPALPLSALAMAATAAPATSTGVTAAAPVAATAGQAAAPAAKAPAAKPAPPAAAELASGLSVTQSMSETRKAVPAAPAVGSAKTASTVAANAATVLVSAAAQRPAPMPGQAAAASAAADNGASPAAGDASANADQEAAAEQSAQPMVTE